MEDMNQIKQTTRDMINQNFEQEEVEIKEAFLAEDLSELDAHALTPLSPEVIQRQATINVGTIGHVSHGKSTVVKALSGVSTVRFRREKQRNITIKLGYANAKIYRRLDNKTELPGGYAAFGSASFVDGHGRVILPLNPEDPESEEVVVAGPGAAKGYCEEGQWELVRHISFVDCPGHDILMATMLNGAAVMDAAVLLVAADEKCPQPQTAEHLAAIEIMKLQHILILQNKVDLVKPEQALEQYNAIKSFTEGTVAEAAPVLPVAAQLGHNVDVVAQHLACSVPVPPRDFLCSPRMILIRSFDVNKPGTRVQHLQGGVAGGSILRGVLRVGQEVEVRPGLVDKDGEGRARWGPLLARVETLHAERHALLFAVPGGLIGVGTSMDPTLTRGDRLVGQVLGAAGQLPAVYSRLEISFYLLRKLLGVVRDGEDAAERVESLRKGEVLMVNVGSTSTGGTVRNLKADLAKLELTTPVCCEVDEKVALSRRVQGSWRLVGWGRISRGWNATLQQP